MVLQQAWRSCVEFYLTRATALTRLIVLRLEPLAPEKAQTFNSSLKSEAWRALLNMYSKVDETELRPSTWDEASAHLEDAKKLPKDQQNLRRCVGTR